MSTPIDDGGPAYPQTTDSMGHLVWHTGFGGLSLRDHFAGQANEDDIRHMINLYATPIEGTDAGDGLGPDKNWPTREHARYLFADAMLTARSQ